MLAGHGAHCAWQRKAITCHSEEVPPGSEVQCADETFKICLDFWHIFAVRLYFDQKQPRALALQNAGAQAEESPLMLDITTATGGTVRGKQDGMPHCMTI